MLAGWQQGNSGRNYGLCAERATRRKSATHRNRLKPINSGCVGEGFVILQLGEHPPSAEPLADAARRRGVPLRIETFSDSATRTLYENGLALIRPDGHVAWRGDASPDNPLALIDLVRGAG